MGDERLSGGLIENGNARERYLAVDQHTGPATNASSHPSATPHSNAAAWATTDTGDTAAGEQAGEHQRRAQLHQRGKTQACGLERGSWRGYIRHPADADVESMNSHAAQDKPSAQELADLRARADAGEASAQFNLGCMYANGRGVPQDYVEAIAWCRRAAEHGHADAQFELGWMYANGQGVPQDDAEAIAWFRPSCRAG